MRKNTYFVPTCTACRMQPDADTGLYKQAARNLLKALPPLLIGIAPAALAQTIINSQTGTYTLSGTGAHRLPSANTVNAPTGIGIASDNSANWNLTIENGAAVTGLNGVFLGAQSGGTVLNNSGRIASTGNRSGGVDYGVRLNAGGTVNNLINGRIESQSDGIYVTASGTVNNAGYISSGQRVTAVYFHAGGAYVGANTSTLTGGHGVIVNAGNGDVTNAGNISTSNIGAWFRGDATGVLTNQAGGTIASTGAASTNYGVRINSSRSVQIDNAGTITGGTGVRLETGNHILTNSGSIIGTAGTAISIAGSNNSLTLKQGTSITGDIVSTGSSNTLALLDNGTLTDGFSGLQSVTVKAAPGQSWTLNGSAMETNGTTAAALDVQSGTLILGGTLTHTGAGGGSTVATGAALQIGSGGTTGSVNGDIVDNGTLAFNRSDDVAFAGQISGSGRLIKDGAGTLILTSPTSSYTGETIVNTGTLRAGAANVIDDSSALTLRAGSAFDLNGFDQRVSQLNGNGDVHLTGAALATDYTADATFGGVIDGAGTFAKTGNATLTLTGNNTYTGMTTVDGGTLQLGNGGASGSINGNVANNATLVFNRSDTVTFADTIGGSGTVQQVGSGTTALTADNSYTGGTTISNGALQLGDGGNTGSIVGNVTNNATLAFNRSDAITFAGTINGSGAVQQIGSGTTALTADNSYTGGTTITSGTLQLGDGGTTGSIVGNVTNNATLAFNRSGAVTFASTIGGSGTVHQIGSGTTILTGDNSYTGGTSIGNGTLQLGDGGSAGSIVGNVANNAILAFNRSDAVAFAGTIDGSGAVHQIGSGTTMLTADNSYTGGTTISNGALQLGDGGTTGSIVGNVTNNATLVFNRSNAIAFAGTISGSGTVQQIGSGTTVLTSDSTYTGGTTIANGALQLGAGGTTGSIVGNVTNNATLAFNRSDAITFAGTISGSGTVQQIGSGTTILTGDNSYTGGTSIGNGTLQLGDGGSTGSIVGNVINNATLAFNRSDAVAFAGTIDGSGTVHQIGSGTTVLTGDNTYTGGTTIASGALQLGDGGATGSIIGDIANNGSLIFDRNNEYAYAGVISGSGNLIQQGSGNLLFGKDQTYTGTTDVNAGALLLTDGAQLAGGGAVTVAPGATLGGYGGVTGNAINRGVLAVANSAPGFAGGPAGTFAVGGNLVNDGEIRTTNAQAANTLDVGGNYTGNNGLLSLSTQLGGDDSPTDRLIVRGDSGGATRISVSNANGAGAQTVNGIEIVRIGGQSNGQFTLSNRLVAGTYEYDLHHGGTGANANDGNWYLRTLTAPDPSPGFGLIPTPSPRPEPTLYVRNLAAASAMFMHTLHDRLGEPQYTEAYRDKARAPKDGNAPAGWVRVVSRHADSESAGGRIDVDTDTSLIHFGGDLARWSDDAKNRYHFGLMAAYGKIDTDASSNDVRFTNNGLRRKASGDVEGYSVGVYGTWFGNDKMPEGPYVDVWASYGWYDNTIKGNGLAKEKYDSDGWMVSVEGGYALIARENETRQWIIEPQAQLAYTKFSADNHREANGTWVNNSDANGFIGRLGARFYSRSKQGDNGVQPFVEANAWYSDAKNSLDFNGVQISDGTPDTRYELKLGAQGEIRRNWQLWGHVGGQWGKDNYDRYEAMVGVKYSF